MSGVDDKTNVLEFLDSSRPARWLWQDKTTYFRFLGGDLLRFLGEDPLWRDPRWLFLSLLRLTGLLDRSRLFDGRLSSASLAGSFFSSMMPRRMRKRWQSAAVRTGRPLIFFISSKVGTSRFTFRRALLSLSIIVWHLSTRWNGQSAKECNTAIVTMTIYSEFLAAN